MGQVKSQIFDLIQINFEVHVIWENALLRNFIIFQTGYNKTGTAPLAFPNTPVCFVVYDGHQNIQGGAVAYLDIPTILHVGFEFLTPYSRVLKNSRICMFYP